MSSSPCGSTQARDDAVSGQLQSYSLCCEGALQGRGVRPRVVKLAKALGICGMVCNRGSGLLIEAQAGAPSWAAFKAQLADQLVLDHNQCEASQVGLHELSEPAREAIEQRHFVIGASVSAGCSLHVPLDRGICPACVAEIRNPEHARYQHLLNACVDCGPRYSALQGLPFDRDASALAPFSLCDDCQQAYKDLDDRRCHEQLISCPQCGPEYRMEDADGACLAIKPDELLAEAAKRIASGQIIAIQGVGGFHLCCDATQPAVVARLRQIKQRPVKPFAVMAHLPQLRDLVRLSPAAAHRLASPERPVMVLPRIRQRCQDSVAGSAEALTGVAPGLDRLGVMLPYTALQWLLLDRLDSPLIMTSANRSGEPMHHRLESMRHWAPPIDGVIYHDRVIERPVEDSVVQALPDDLPVQEQTLRLGRGLAPLVMDDLPADFFPQPQGNVLAMGGELKNSIAVAVADANAVVMSPYQGDLYDAEVLRGFVPGFMDLLGVRTHCVVVDAHPDYQASRFGEELAGQWQVPLVRVQHHHAHAVAVMAEHGLPMDQRVPAIVMDGLGWGDDNTLWGGELLYCNGREYHRLAALQSFPVLGGNQTARQPWRNALALLASLSEESLEQFQQALLQRYPEKHALIHGAATLARRPQEGLLTSSVGRLFDGVAAILGFPGFEISDEAEAAVWLQQQAQAAAEVTSTEAIRERTAACVSAAVSNKGQVSPQRVDPAPFLEYLLRQLPRQSSGELALAFHHWLAESFFTMLCALRQAGALSPDSSQVVLGGGVMQNGLLLQCLTDSLQRQGFTALLPGRIPANDNGLALGQALIGQQRLATNQRSVRSCV